MSDPKRRVGAPGVRKSVRGLVAVTLLSGLALAGPGLAAGFDLFAQGAKAAGMAGAFVAQADDPTAVFYNPAGLAFKPPPPAKPKKVALGLTAWTLNDGLYQGLAPGSGAGTTGDQATSFQFPPHAFLAKPLGPGAVLGLGVYTPFLLDTEWANPGSFAGRFVSTKAQLVTYDVAPTLAFRLSKSLAFGAGAIYRTSKISQDRRISLPDPDTGRPIDVASAAADTDFETGYGWSAGLLFRPSPRFSLGASYRSAITTDYKGVERLTQVSTGDAAFDALVKASLPLGEDLALATSLELPDITRFGMALGLTKSFLVELDAEKTGWSGIQALAFTLPSNPELDQTVELRFDDSMAYRMGLQWTAATGPQLRLGYALEQSPQPDATVGPFLADSNRSVYTAGIGLDWLNVAFAWIANDQRIVTTNVDGINGNWRSSAWLLSLTVSK